MIFGKAVCAQRVPNLISFSSCTSILVECVIFHFQKVFFFQIFKIFNKIEYNQTETNNN